MQDGGGKIIKDFCGNSTYTNGFLNNPSTLSAGRFGNCLYFNGTNNVVDIPDSTYLLPMTNDWSVSVWIKYNSQSSIVPIIIKRTNGGSYTQIQMGIGYVDSSGNGQTTNQLYLFSYPNLNGIHTNSSFGDNQWHHVVFIRPSSNASSIWVDGINQNLTTDTNSGVVNINNLGTDWTFGGAPTEGFFYNGYMQDVRFYNKVLNASEINALYTL